MMNKTKEAFLIMSACVILAVSIVLIRDAVKYLKQPGHFNWLGFGTNQEEPRERGIPAVDCNDPYELPESDMEEGVDYVCGNPNDGSDDYEDYDSGSNGPGTHYTRDYYRKDGTHVSGYEATNPDGNPDNNFSSK